MKLYFRLTTFILILVSCTAKEKEKSLLWKIESDSTETSYIFGTIHSIPSKDFLFKEKIKKALNETEQTFFEVDIDNANTEKIILAEGYLEKNDNLRLHMNEYQFNILNDYLIEHTDFEFNNFNNFKPYILTATIINTFTSEETTSVDNEILRYSKTTLGNEISGLESPKESLSSFELLSVEKQIDQLVEMIEKKDETQILFTEIKKAYLNEDVDYLYKLTEEYYSSDREFLEMILDNRNQIWVDRILDFSKNKSIFYAFGAAHFGGPNGILTLLDSAEFRITPIYD